MGRIFPIPHIYVLNLSREPSKYMNALIVVETLDVNNADATDIHTSIFNSTQSMSN